MRRTVLSAAALAVVVAQLVSPSVAASALGKADYEALKEWRFGAERPLPTGGFVFRSEEAEWTLESGRLQLQEPTADGAVTGLVFEGEGSFRMAVPDRFELEQLRRFSGEKELGELDETFSHLVLRTADPELLRPLLEAAAGPYKTDPLARERHDFWLRIRRLDADAKVASALLNPDESYLRVDMKTERFGWLTYDFNSRRHEEVRIEHFNKGYAFLEQWLSLDSAGERLPSGRPGDFEGRDLDVEHVDVRASLLRLGKDPGTSETSRHTTNGDFVVRVSFVSRRPGVRALQFFLHPFAEVKSVRDAEGRELEFLRDNIGRRSSALDNRIFDHSLLVLAPEPLAAGETQELEFEYELEVRNFLPGRAWYPGVDTVDTALRDLHTASIEVVTKERYDVRAMGEPEHESSGDGLTRRSFRIDRPMKMATFATARRVIESRLEAEELPEVIVFSTPIGSDTELKLERIARDVQAAIAFLEGRFGVELPIKRLQTTLIQSGHGQAFDGFLHLAEEAAFRDRTGPVELFIAHEVAHQWAGHLIGWGSYRDQWLSEGLAQYLALLYLEASLERGDELFLEAIQAHTDEINGSIKSQLSPFSRGALPLANKAAARRVGPIGHGYRAAVGESPAAFLSQSYRKGALVLHMLRVLSRFSDGGEQTFYDMLRDFLSTHTGGYPSTADLAAVAEKHLGGEWGWFFDQWVYGAAIPTYKWKSRTATAADGGHRVELTVRQEDVPEGFRMSVPVRVELAGGGEENHLVEVREAENEFVLEVGGKPKKVVFNPDFSVLAKTLKR
jgi:hypothetical protein